MYILIYGYGDFCLMLFDVWVENIVLKTDLHFPKNFMDILALDDFIFCIQAIATRTFFDYLTADQLETKQSIEKVIM